jgi:hypothetical protein
VSVLTVPSQPRGWKSLPTEFRSFNPGDGAERLARTGEGLQGMGGWVQDIADLTKVTGAVTLKILAAKNPGLRVTESPDGTVQIYNTAGQQELLPGNYGFDAATQTFYQKNPGGSVTTPNLKATWSLGDMDPTTIALIGVVALLGIMAFKK